MTGHPRHSIFILYIIQVNLNWFTSDCVMLSEAKHLYD